MSILGWFRKLSNGLTWEQERHLEAEVLCVIYANASTAQREYARRQIVKQRRTLGRVGYWPPVMMPVMLSYTATRVARDLVFGHVKKLKNRGRLPDLAIMSAREILIAICEVEPIEVRYRSKEVPTVSMGEPPDLILTPEVIRKTQRWICDELVGQADRAFVAGRASRRY